jgi:hypothetical protein
LLLTNVPEVLPVDLSRLIQMPPVKNEDEDAYADATFAEVQKQS